MLTGTVSYLVTNLLVPTGLEHGEINEGSVYNPRNQINATNSVHSQGKEHWVLGVLNNLPGTKFLPCVFNSLCDLEM